MYDQISIVLRNVGLGFLASPPSPSRSKNPDGHQTSVFHTKLPTEVIYIIFGFLFDKFYSPPYSSPLLIACVCREWQVLIFANPLFWSTIQLSFSEESWSSEDNLYTEKWLRRSCNVPLTISLRVTHNPPEVNNRSDSLNPINYLINLVAQNRRRWQDLSLDIPLHHLIHFFSYISGSEKPAIVLRSLCIKVRDDCSQDLLPSVWMSSVQSTRKLLPSYLTLLLDCPPPVEINRFLLDLFVSNRLRKISIGPITFGVLFDIMASSEDLEVADIGIEPELQNGVVTTQNFPPPPTRTMLRLQELSIIESDEIFDINTSNNRLLERLLQAFTLPSLNALEYKGPISFTSAIHVDEISEFISRSGCSLVTLKLLRVAIRGGELRRILRNMPRLRELFLDTNYSSDDPNEGADSAVLTDDFFIDLWAEPPLLPKLVHIFYEGPLTFSWNSVVGVFSNALMQSNIPVRSSLQYLKINIWGPLLSYPPPDLLDVLLDLRLNGRQYRKVTIQHENMDIIHTLQQEAHKYRMESYFLWSGPDRGRSYTYWAPKTWI